MNLFDNVTKQVMELMQTHGSDWTQSWTEAGAPQNASTGRPYQGMNIFSLSLSACVMQGTNYWATYNQWSSLGAQVRKGEKSTVGVFFKPMVRGETEDERKAHLMAKPFFVFNASQVDGWTLPTATDRPPLELDAKLEELLARTQAKVDWTAGSPWFSSQYDLIGMPAKQDFFDEEALACTLLHELTHWTGHRSRLDRHLRPRQEKLAYALEELVAELGSAFMAIHYGIVHQPRVDHAQYLNYWLDILGNNPRAFHKACSAAQAATSYLIGHTNEDPT